MQSQYGQALTLALVRDIVTLHWHAAMWLCKLRYQYVVAARRSALL